MTVPGTVLLSGIVGSTAYGMAHEGSDIDRLGMYAERTERWHGLAPPTINDLTWTSEVKPDIVMHEALKAVGLLLACNPAVTELLWLPGELYETREPLGEELIGLRRSLLSVAKVRDSYFRYAQRQHRTLTQLVTRGDGASQDGRKRIAKLGRHMLRLLQQGADLHLTGELTVRLTDHQVQQIRDFGERVGDDPEIARVALAQAEHRFDCHGTLPERPDERAAEAWLLLVRREFYA